MKSRGRGTATIQVITGVTKDYQTFRREGGTQEDGMKKQTNELALCVIKMDIRG